LHSHYSYDYLKRQKPQILTKLLVHSRSSEIKQKAWEKWLVLYHASQFIPNFSLQNFETYIKEDMPVDDEISDDEYDRIMKNAEEAKARHQKAMKR